MTTIRVDAPAFRDLCLAAVRALEETTEANIDGATMADLYMIVEKWHPESSVKKHFRDFIWNWEVIHDLNP